MKRKHGRVTPDRHFKGELFESTDLEWTFGKLAKNDHLLYCAVKVELKTLIALSLSLVGKILFPFNTYTVCQVFVHR